MKKILISIGSIVIMALVVVLFVNASDSGKDKKKPAAEVKTTVNPAPCSATCGTPEGASASKCQPAACNETAAKSKETNCDPATCLGHKETAPQETKACAPAPSCAATCQSKPEGNK